MPITCAGFAPHDDLQSLGADVAIIGVPYASPYLKKQSYSSQNAAATIRQQSLRYQKTGNFDFDFNGDLFGGQAVKCVDCGDLIKADFEYYRGFSPQSSIRIKGLSR